jgi:hypothetical protein
MILKELSNTLFTPPVIYQLNYHVKQAFEHCNSERYNLTGQILNFFIEIASSSPTNLRVSTGDLHGR